MGVGWSQEPWRPVSLPQALLLSPWEGRQPARGGESGSVLAWAGVWGEDLWSPLSIGALADWSLCSLPCSASRGIEGLGLAGEERQHQPRGRIEDGKVCVHILPTVGFK